MEIGGINIGLPKLGKNKENSNKPLANLKEPIKDSFVKRSKDKEDVAAALSEVRNIKDSNGKQRYSDYDVDINFKYYYNNGTIDVAAAKELKDTPFDFATMSKVYVMKKESENENLYKTVSDCVKKVSEKNTVTDFEQNKFNPNEEFSLVCQKKHMDKLEKAFSQISTIGTEYKYNTNGELIQKTKGSVDFVPDGDSNVRLVRREKDYRNNTEITQIQGLDKTLNPYLKEQTTIKKSKDDKEEYREIMTASDSIDGVYNIQRKYPDGTVKDISKSSIDPKTGIKTIKKDMMSTDGTRTEFLYEDDPQGNRIIDYKITQKDGKILMRNSQSFEVVNDNKFISSKNGIKYEITTDEKGMKIKDLHHETETSIDFEKKFKGNTKELVSLLKKVPGEELFEIVDSIKKLNGKDKNKVLDSFYSPLTKKINTSDNLFVFLHELGHAKDHQNEKSLLDLLKNNSQYTNNKTIQKAYLNERENFNKNHSDAERNIIDYFIQAKGHYQGKWGGLGEAVAETNALTNTYTDGPIKCLGSRTQLLQQHFPKTIAAIQDAMDIKNQIAAIEFYGT